MNTKIVIGAVIFILIGGFLYFQNASQKDPMNNTQENKNSMMKGSPEGDVMKKDVDENMMMEMKQMTYMYSGNLVDVTKGEVRGINTKGQSSGAAKANFGDNKYMMIATFSNLLDPLSGDFYEGWIVQKSPFKFISTGKVEKKEGFYINIYSSGEDLTSFNRYVLTLEPDDGDPAPADHIVEGDMLK